MPPRIDPAEPPYSSAIAATLERLMPSGVEPLVLFRVMARDERLFSRFMGAGLLDKGHLTLQQREVAIHRTCALGSAEYEWGVHAALLAQKAQLSEALLAATVHGTADDPAFSAEDRLIVRLCDKAFHDIDVDDGLWGELVAAFGEMGTLELLMLCGFYRTVSLLVRSLRLPAEPWARSFPPFEHRDARPTTHSGETAAEAEAFFVSYREAFARFDAAAIVDHFAFPLTITGDSGEIAVTTFVNAADWRAAITKFLDLYRLIGVVSGSARSSATEFSPRLVRLDVDWELYDGASTPIYDFKASYTLAKSGGDWRIAAITHNELVPLQARLAEVRMKSA